MTLTTSPATVFGLTHNERLELLQRNFRSIKDRYEKEFGKPFGDYFSVRTQEGYGVIHIVYRGAFIPRDWIVQNWNELHGSQIIDIREPRGAPYSGAYYLVGQYIAGQPDYIYGLSHDWIWRHFPNDYKDVLYACRDWRRPIFIYGFWTAPIDYKRLRREWRRCVWNKLFPPPDVEMPLFPEVS